MTSSLLNDLDISPIAPLLANWLDRRLSDDARGWFRDQVTLIHTGERPLQLGIAVGLAPRKVGKEDLDLTAEEQEAGRQMRSGLDTTGWSIDQAARILLALASHRRDDEAFAEGLARLFATAEIGEQIALLKGLAVFPAAGRLLPHALEGIRSAMQPIFEAVAHRNPYPREHFSEAQWNQMVVKTLFIGSRLAPIQGLDARRNAELAHMLVDYAAERRAAGRSISPELWRCVAPFAGEADVAMIAAVLNNGTAAEQAGAALALAECPLDSAKVALGSHPELAAAIREGRIHWNAIV